MTRSQQVHHTEIAASVEAGFAEQIAYTQELMRFRSVRGAEHAIQDFVFRAFRSRGYAMERFAMDRDAIGRHPGDLCRSPTRQGLMPRGSKGAGLPASRLSNSATTVSPLF